MGPLKLPFQGRVTEHQVLNLTDTGNHQETDMMVAIVFDRTRGNGRVIVRLSDVAGDEVLLEANQAAPHYESAKALTVPLKYNATARLNGVWIQETSEGARFSIQISTVG